MIRYKFKEAFAQSGQSIREIARGAGISHPTLLRLRDARMVKEANVGTDVLQKLCDYLGCQGLDELVEYTSHAKQGVGGKS